MEISPHPGHRQRPQRETYEPDALAEEVTNLTTLDARQIRQQWQMLYGHEPSPRLGRAFLIRALAYRLQERVLGGLKPATRRLLAEAVKSIGKRVPTTPTPLIRPGIVLLREWHGTTHRVVILDEGVEWRDRCYRSLSEVARAITGTRWSGPRFFGLLQD
jgi:hypothetical protein